MKFKMTSYIQIILLFKEQNSKLSPKKYVFDFKFYNRYFYVAKFVFNSPQLQNHHKNSYFHYIYIKLVLLCPVTWETRGSVGWACVAHLSFCFEETLYRTFMVLPTKFRFIWLLIFRGEDYLEIDQSETRITYGGHVC